MSSGLRPPTPTSPENPNMAAKPLHAHTRAPLRRKHIAPDVGSLYDLLHDHAHISLYLQPICWTDLHTQVLGCRFVQLPPQKTPTPSQSGSPRRHTPPTVKKIMGNLSTLMSTERDLSVVTQTRALKHILSALFPAHLSKAKTCADFGLRFGNRCYLRQVRCQAVWKHPDSTSISFDSATTCSNLSSQPLTPTSAHSSILVVNNAPILAYVSRSQLNHIRRNCYRVLPGPNRIYNGPVHRLQALRSKLLMPKNPDEDAYIIAVMIAIAQQAAYSHMSFNPRDQKVRVLTTSEEDESFVVYTGIVPAAFLRMLHEPEKAPQGDTEIKIGYTQVPVWPVLGLKERLGLALGSEVVGELDVNNMETWEDELPPTPETPSPKRRREVLTEVFNASFSEDRDSDSPVDSIRKRRCLEEGRVEVVR